jgi:hypothetical protein
MKTYKINEIQKVYKQFYINPHSVVYSEDNGLTWKSPPMDTGKWNLCEYINPWLFAFIK